LEWFKIQRRYDSESDPKMDFIRSEKLLKTVAVCYFPEEESIVLTSAQRLLETSQYGTSVKGTVSDPY